MCGLVGFSGSKNSAMIKKMNDSINHRGPDDESFLETDNFSVGFRRLAIIDLHKNLYPITNEDETLKIFLNGEIYNYQELKRELIAAGHSFKTESDTEVVAHGYEEWGLNIIKRLRGMFAIVLYDVKEDVLIISRDRLGIKPLYYTEFDGRVIFSSEIKGLLNFPIDRSADLHEVEKFLRYRVHDDSKNTFFKNIKRLMPGHNMILDNQSNYRIEKYWEPTFSTQFASTKSDAEYASEFKEIFVNAIDLHLIGDVPVGVTLSGGLDSSGITSIANKLYKEKHSDQPFYAFSAIHPGETINEEEYIDEVVNFTGVTSIKMIPDLDKFWEDFDTWLYFQEEPVISGAPYAYYTVMREARKKVTVLLSGQGGDELLAGYIPYFLTYLKSAIDNGKYIQGLREMFAGRDLYSKFFFDKLVEQIKSEAKIDIQNIVQKVSENEVNFKSFKNLNERLFQDVTKLTTPSLLRYEDKNSMANSLESRVPFFDHVVVEYIFNLPIDQKIKHGWNRFIYRNAVKGLIPEKNRLRRSKVGFTNPEWEWIERKQDKFIEVFESDTFKSREFWNANLALTEFKDALSGKKKGDIMFFWRLFITEMWLRKFVD